MNRIRNFLLGVSIALVGVVPVWADCAVELVATADVVSTIVAESGTLAVASAGSNTATLIDLSGVIPDVRGVITTSRAVIDAEVGELTIAVEDETGPGFKAIDGVVLLTDDGSRRTIEVFGAEDRDTPTFLGSAQLLGQPTSIWMSGSTVYVGEIISSPGSEDRGRIEIFTLQSDGAPALIDYVYETTAVAGFGVGITTLEKNGNTMLIGMGEAGLELADISDPWAPVFASQLAVPGGVWSAASGSQASYFFVGAGENGWFSIQAANRETPAIAASIPTGGAAVTSLSAQGETLVVGIAGTGFDLYDLTDPSAPGLIRTVTTGHASADLVYPGVVAGSQLVLVGDDADGFSVYDITFCLCTRETGRLDPAKAAEALVVNGRSVYAVDGISSFYVADFGSRAPLLRGEVVLDSAPVAVATLPPARFGYVVGSTGSGGRLHVVDATNASAPTVFSAFDLTITPTSVENQLGILYVGGGRDGKGYVQAVSVLDPSAPALLSEVLVADGSTVHDLDLEDELLVAAAGTTGLATIDISDPSAMAVVGHYVPSAGSITTVGLVPPTAYVGLETLGVEAVDVSVATAPVRLAGVETGASVTAINAFSGRVAVGVGSAGFILYDTFDPNSFEFIEGLQVAGDVQDIVNVSLGPGNTILALALSNSGLAGIDISTCVSRGAAPIAAFGLTPDPPAAGESVSFIDNSRNRPTAWLWNFGDGQSSTIENPQHSYGAGGVYNVTLTASNIIGSDVASRLIFVSGTTGNPDTGLANSWYLPASAQAAGQGNTVWSTDVSVLNRSGSSAHVLMSFLGAERNNLSAVPSHLVVVPGNQAITLREVVGSTFGQASASGGIQVSSSSSNLLVTSRTFNKGGEVGTFGQFIAGYTTDDALRAGQTGQLIQLENNVDFRTNIGFLSASGGSITVEVRLLAGDGSVFDSGTWVLEPFSYLQVTRIFEVLGVTTGVSNARAEIRIIEGTGPMFAYASIVDNASGDAIFQPAVQ